MGLKEKLSCSVRVPTTIRVTEIILQAEVTKKSWLCFVRRVSCPIVSIYLDHARREKLGDGTYAYRVCGMRVHLKKIQELKADCFVKMKVKRGMGTMRKKAIDAQHLIQCFQEHRNFGKIHINLDVSSFHPLTFELELQTKGVQETNEIPSVLALQEKISCSVRVPRSIRVTEITLQAEETKPWLCYAKRLVYPIITVYLDPARRQKIDAWVCKYPVCGMHVDMKRIQNLDPDCYVKMKVKRGMGTMRKKDVDVRQLIQSLKEHSVFGKIHINIDVFSFHSFVFELALETKRLEEVNLEFIRARKLQNKISCSVRVPTTIRVTEIILQAEVIKSWRCFAKKFVYPIMTIYLHPARRQKLGDGTYAYRVCGMHVDLKKIQELKTDCFVKMKVKRGMGTMRKKEMDAQHLIQCLQEHRKFGKIHLNLDVSSLHPLSFELNIKVKELQQPKELQTTEEDGELIKESALPIAAPLPSLTNTQAAGDSVGRNEADNAIAIQDLPKAHHKTEDLDKTECQDESEDLKEVKVNKESDECKGENEEDLEESDELQDVRGEWEDMSGEWEYVGDEWEDVDGESENETSEWEDMSGEWEGDENEDAPLGEQRQRATEEGQNTRPSHTSRWHDLYHAAKRYAWRALVFQVVLFTVGAVLDPYIPEVDLGGGY